MKFIALALLFLSATFAFALGCDGSGNCYIYASSTCTTSCGATWATAYKGFGTSAGDVNPASMTRGVTYWIAAGSYGAQTFSTADSSTTVITIEGATTANHGPDSTWNNSYAGTATFGESSITTDYWVINGQTWTGSSCVGLMACGVDAAYTIYFDNTTDDQGYALQVGPGTNYTIEYVDMQGPHNISQWSSNTGNCGSGGATNYGDVGFATNTNSGASSTNNVYVGYSYIHDVGVDLVSSNAQDNSLGYNGENHTYDHDFLARNWYTGTGSTTCNHTQAMSECTVNLTVRYTEFFDVVQDGVIDVNVPSSCTMSNWYIYGNLLTWDGSIPTVRQALADGFIGLFGEAISGVLAVTNNTIANVTCGSSCGILNMTLIFDCGSGSSGCGTTYESGVVFDVYNNLFYNSGNNPDTESGLASNYACDDSPCAPTVNQDYNVGYCPSGGCSNSGGYQTAGSHDLNETGNPFVNFDGSSNFNVALTANTPAGLSISGWSSVPSGCSSGTNCQNIDAFGVTRGANGTIDRGALQIAGASTSSTFSGLILNGITLH